jgi:hypothetical protein
MRAAARQHSRAGRWALVAGLLQLDAYWGAPIVAASPQQQTPCARQEHEHPLERRAP